MVWIVTLLAVAGMLAFLGAAQSHWIAPAALFAVSAPVVMVMSHHLPIEQTAAHQSAVLAGYYVVFAIGRWTAQRILHHSQA